MRLADLIRRDAGRYDTGVAPLEVDARYWRPKPMEAIVGPGSTRTAGARAPATSRAPVADSTGGGLRDSDWREVFREIVRGDFEGTPSQQREGAVVRGARLPRLENQAGAGILHVALWSSLGEDEAARQELERVILLMGRIEAEKPPSPGPGRQLDFPDRVERAEYRLGKLPYQLAKEVAKRFGKRGGFGPLVTTVDAATDLTEEAYAQYQSLRNNGVEPEEAAKQAARRAMARSVAGRW